jgi:lysophospholipase L1-like esterase
MYRVFISADLEPGQLRNAVASAESYLFAPHRLDFYKQVDQSFLPEMIRLSKERGIQLVLVRLKSQLTGTGNAETPAVRQYIADLTDYLDNQGVIFLDYGRDPRLARKYFKDEIHLTPEGEVAFTHILADGLNEVLK